MKEKLPFVSVVDASTLPEGLISTTTTFGIPPLFASTTRPLILMVERRRDAAARAESSEVAGVGDSVGVALGFVGAGWVAVGAGSGDGEGKLAGAVFVSVGLLVSEGVGVGDFSGFGEPEVGSADVVFCGFAAASVDGDAAGVDSGLALTDGDGGAGAAAVVVALIFSSRPSNEPFRRRYTCSIVVRRIGSGAPAL